MFGISPKYKFRLTLSVKNSNENTRPYGCRVIKINLMYCGNLDIKLIKFHCDLSNQEFGCQNFIFSENLSHQEENFLNMIRCHFINDTTVALKLELKMEVKNCCGIILEYPYHSLSEL